MKYKEGKLRFDLIPPDALFEVAKTFELGAKSHGERDWEKGNLWGLVSAAIDRHHARWKAGQRFDEDGQYHMAAIAASAMMLMSQDMRGIGTDDRSKCTIDERKIHDRI